MLLTKSKKQVILLYGATLTGTLLGVVSSIINTRFMDTGDYGDVRYVQNILSFIASLLLFGYFLSGSRLLALSNDEYKSRRIRGCMVTILIAASTVLIVSCFILFFIFKRDNPIVAHLFLVSAPVCLYPLFHNYINTTAQGDNHIGRLASSRFVPAVFYIPVAYFIYSNFGATSSRMILLQWGLNTTILLMIIVSTRPLFKDLKPIMMELNRENRDYGLQLYIGSLVMVATNYIAGITIGIFNGDNSEVGFYTLALTVTSPLSTLPSIIGTTYFKKFATEKKIPQKVLKYSLTLTILSCVLFIIFIKPIVSFLYPDRYYIVGTYASWLAVGFSIHGLGDMINRYLGSQGQGKSIRNSSFFNGLFKIFGFTVLVYFFNTNGAIMTNIICSSIYFATLLYYYKKYTLNF